MLERSSCCGSSRYSGYAEVWLSRRTGFFRCASRWSGAAINGDTAEAEKAFREDLAAIRAIRVHCSGCTRLFEGGEA